MISADQAESITRGAKAVEKSWQDLTPEQEYYIGRAVAAQVFQTYPPLDRPQANEYLNLLGQSLAIFSDRPETFGGYHFLLLDSDEINAFAAPGGLILVTRGMLRCCENEDELAAVLAHEICHVEQKHGLSAIKQGRLTEAFTIIAAESAKQMGGEELAALTRGVRGVGGRRGDDPHDQRLLAEAGTRRGCRRGGNFFSVPAIRTAAMITMLQRMDERLADARRPRVRQDASVGQEPRGRASSDDRRMRGLLPIPSGSNVSLRPCSRSWRASRTQILLAAGEVRHG